MLSNIKDWADRVSGDDNILNSVLTQDAIFVSGVISVVCADYAKTAGVQRAAEIAFIAGALWQRSVDDGQEKSIEDILRDIDIPEI